MDTNSAATDGPRAAAGVSSASPLLPTRWRRCIECAVTQPVMAFSVQMSLCDQCAALKSTMAASMVQNIAPQNDAPCAKNRGCFNVPIKKEASNSYHESGAQMDHVDKYGPDLIYAAENGYQDVVEMLLESGAAIDFVDEHGRTALIYAAWKGHRDVVEVLLKNGVATSHVDKYGKTASIYAAFYGHRDVVERLLQAASVVQNIAPHDDAPCVKNRGCFNVPIMKEASNSYHESGAQMDHVDKYGLDLIYAAKNGYQDVVEMLLESGAAVDHVDQDGRTALIFAALKGHRDVVEVLLKSGAAVDHAETSYGRTALIHAVEKGHRDVVEVLLKSGAAVDHVDKVWGQGKTALINAVEKGHRDVVEVLLKSGAAVDHVDHYGTTALIYAVEKGHRDVVEVLLKSGAAVDHADTSYGTTALIYAVEKGHRDVVEVLLKSGAAVDHADTSYGRTALIYAVEKGHRDVVEVLLKSGAATNIEPSYDHKTALIHAVEKGQRDVVEVLLKSGAAIDFVDEHGRTALIHAAWKGHRDVVEVLLKSGAAIDQGFQHKTALIHAVEKGHRDVVDVLLKSGAATNHADSNGDTALLIAAKRGDLDSVDMLLENGAGVDQIDANGQTALLFASQRRFEDMVDLLLKSKASMVSTPSGITPLMAAAAAGSLRIVNSLLDYGADRRARDELGRDAYFYADREEDDIMEILEPPLLNDLLDACSADDSVTAVRDLLCDHTDVAVDLNAGKKNHNWTSLMEATSLGSVALVQFLLDHGVDMEIKTLEGFSAFFWAQVRGERAVVDLYKTYMPSIKEQEGVERLREVRAKSLANSKLLNVQQQASSPTTSRRFRGENGNIAARMSDLTSSTKAVSFYDASYRPRLSLLDFLLCAVIPKYEKMNETQECNRLDAMICDGKRVVIMYTATHGDNTMSPEDVFALFCYTFESIVYKESNKAMRDFSSSPVDLQFWLPFVYYCDQALSKIEAISKSTLVFRGIGIPWTKLYYEGSEFVWNSFTSVSENLKVAKRFSTSPQGGMVFLIVTSKVKSVKAFSAFPAEEEVVFRPNLHLKVIFTEKIGFLGDDEAHANCDLVLRIGLDDFSWENTPELKHFYHGTLARHRTCSFSENETAIVVCREVDEDEDKKVHPKAIQTVFYS